MASIWFAHSSSWPMAAGFPWSQEELSQRGHALECRVYAEDPAHGFLPQAGPLLLYREPSGPGIRVDSGVTEGDRVGVNYDPLLAKLIVFAETREAARTRAAERAEELSGARHAHQYPVPDQAARAAGLPRRPPAHGHDRGAPRRSSPSRTMCRRRRSSRLHSRPAPLRPHGNRRRRPRRQPTPGPRSGGGGGSTCRAALIVWTLADDDRQYQVEVMDDGARQEARVEQRVYEVARDGHGELRIASDRTTTAWTVAAGDVRWVFVDGRVFELDRSASARARPRRRAPRGR